MVDADLICFGYFFGDGVNMSQRFIFSILFILLLSLLISIKALYFRSIRGGANRWDIDFGLRNFIVVLVSFSSAIYLSHKYVGFCYSQEGGIWTGVFSDLNIKSVLIGAGVISLMVLSFWVKHIIFDDLDDDSHHGDERDE